MNFDEPINVTFSLIVFVACCLIMALALFIIGESVFNAIGAQPSPSIAFVNLSADKWIGGVPLNAPSFFSAEV